MAPTCSRYTISIVKVNLILIEFQLDLDLTTYCGDVLKT